MGAGVRSPLWGDRKLGLASNDVGPRSRRRLEYVSVAAVVAAAAVVRYWGLRFGLPDTTARPDESRIVNLAVRIALGDLNPHYFVYPTLYMYMLAAVIRLQVGAAALAQLAGTPFAVLDWPTFSDGLTFAAGYLQTGHVHDGRTLATPAAPWYYLSSILPMAAGWPTFVAGVVGLGLLAWRRRREGVACVVFAAVYFATAASGLTVFARYMVPLVPFVCLGAAYAIRQSVQPIHDARIRVVLTSVILAALLVPAAAKTVRLDRLLSTPDSRLVVGGWAEEYVPAGSSIWQSGSTFGKVQLPPDRYVELLFDEPTNSFSRAGGAGANLPDYIFLQQSPLRLYSVVPPAIPEVLKTRYRLVRTFRTGLSSLQQEEFDASDAFFLPLRRLDRIRRPGPEFEIHKLVDPSPPSRPGRGSPDDAGRK